METCGICLHENVKGSKNIKLLDCGHNFCEKCINIWLIEKGTKGTCPMCRANVDSVKRLDAFEWGLKYDLTCILDIHIYQLVKLDEYDYLWLLAFCSRYIEERAVLTGRAFNLFQEYVQKEYPELLQKFGKKGQSSFRLGIYFFRSMGQ
jgi:hypothetical protein